MALTLIVRAWLVRAGIGARAVRDRAREEIMAALADVDARVSDIADQRSLLRALYLSLARSSPSR
jgi:hypothetical protein